MLRRRIKDRQLTKVIAQIPPVPGKQTLRPHLGVGPDRLPGFFKPCIATRQAFRVRPQSGLSRQDQLPLMHPLPAVLQHRPVPLFE